MTNNFEQFSCRSAFIAPAVAMLLAGCAAMVPNAGFAPPNAPAAVPANSAPPLIVAASNNLVGPVFAWQRTRMSDDKVFTPEAPERYTVTFAPGGRAEVRADCNRGTTSYEIDGNRIRFGPVALTRMACPAGSRDADFLRGLTNVQGFLFANGDLVLTIAMDSGSMFFRPLPG
jgi:heat shock protein HslJ